jgi:predicted DCC family thiol-disulfide oxidoreductase YuxK
MNCLYVLYDAECALCQRCRAWLMRQEAFIELRFLPLQSPDIPRRFPGIEELVLREKLVVISDEGAVYQGQNAWIMCLYALREYRAWAQRLAQPALLPFARMICELVSTNRLAISRLLKRPDVEVGGRLAALRQAGRTCEPQNRSALP